MDVVASLSRDSKIRPVRVNHKVSTTGDGTRKQGGKHRNRSNRFFAIYCDLLRFITIFFSEINLDTGKRLKRTVKIYSLHVFPFSYSRKFKIDRVESYRMAYHYHLYRE